MPDPDNEEREGLLDKVKDFLEKPLWGTGKDQDAAEEAAPPTQAAPRAPATPAPTARGGSGSGTTRAPSAPAAPGTSAGRTPAEAKPAPPSAPVQPKPVTPPMTEQAPVETQPPAQANPSIGSPAPAASGSSAESAVQPVPPTSPPPTPDPAPAPAPQTGLRVGGIAYVRQTGGMPLRMRSTPRITADNIVSRLPMGTRLTLLDGPQAADGYDWWHVRTPNGHTGWVAGSELVTEE